MSEIIYRKMISREFTCKFDAKRRDLSHQTVHIYMMFFNK